MVHPLLLSSSMKKTCLFSWLLFSSAFLCGGIHVAPIVVVAKTVPAIEFHQTGGANPERGAYRLFRSDAKGSAVPIPFQIDERNQYGDFVLDQGPDHLQLKGNGLFDGDDELSFMGDDVGEVNMPTQWAFAKPSILYELKIASPQKQGAVYVGIYYKNPPPLSPRRYVDYHISEAEIRTSNYQYFFNPKNYLVVRGVSVIDPMKITTPLIYSSTFYLKVDLKYFLTFQINQDDVESHLQAYKTGPIRVIARVEFSYKFLKINFDLGMYTEVSFFGNSVILPAVIENPFSGRKTLNAGSMFYYGFTSVKNPKDLSITSNMPTYSPKSSMWDSLGKEATPASYYWVTALDPTFMLFMEIGMSPEMKRSKTLPMLYVENEPGAALRGRLSKAKPLGESPVNVGIAMDMSTLEEGTHTVSFQLFIDNHPSQAELENIKGLRSWRVTAHRLLLPPASLSTPVVAPQGATQKGQRKK